MNFLEENAPKVLNLYTQRGAVAFLINRRYNCRVLMRYVDALHELNRVEERAATKLRETKNPMMARRADVIDASVKKRREAIRKIGDDLAAIGQELVEVADLIDATVPRSVLLDVLGVNRADRAQLEESDGIVQIVYARGLEDSAENRGKDEKCGPLFNAVYRRFMRELIHNQKLKKAAHEKLFGPGGLFEFLPRYRMLPDGSMERLPPPLRLACEVDQRAEEMP